MYGKLQHPTLDLVGLPLLKEPKKAGHAGRKLILIDFLKPLMRVIANQELFLL